MDIDLAVVWDTIGLVSYHIIVKEGATDHQQHKIIRTTQRQQNDKQNLLLLLKNLILTKASESTLAGSIHTLVGKVLCVGTQ